MGEGIFLFLINRHIPPTPPTKQKIPRGFPGWGGGGYVDREILAGRDTVSASLKGNRCAAWKDITGAFNDLVGASASNVRGPGLALIASSPGLFFPLPAPLTQKTGCLAPLEQSPKILVNLRRSR